MKKFFTSLLTFFLFFASLSAELFDPISIYLTWQKNPETTMTIQWITRQDRPEDEVIYQEVGQGKKYSAKGSHQPMPYHHPYYIHRVELTNLKPGTDYIFSTGLDAVAYKFRTMPETLAAPICFAVGGDVYHDEIVSVAKMNRCISKKDPLFALVGGDLAYSAPSGSFMFTLKPKEESTRWMQWLIGWKKEMITSDGRLIPIVPAIGNHETIGGEGQTPEQAQFFYALFPFPGKQGCNALDFGDYLSVILLDTGHTHEIEGNQTEWLKNALKQRKHIPHKFALYHEGGYPSHRSPHSKTSRAIRKHWVPLFEKYGLSAAFENHDHTYKRSHLIKEGKIDPQGILYLGDGCWGISNPRIPKSRWYLAKTAAVQHVMLVTLSSQERHYQAIGVSGNTIDEFVQKNREFSDGNIQNTQQHSFIPDALHTP